MPQSGQFPTTRMRRLRGSQKVRDLVRETKLDISKLVMPLFIKHGNQLKNPITSMPGLYQLSVDQLEEEVKSLVKLGIRSVILFGIPKEKDSLGKDSYSEQGIIQQAIPVVKKAAPDMLVITDVCFCEYTDNGHCGVIDHEHRQNDVDVHNDKTLELIAKQALSHARAGADMVAPSGNMDGMVHAIRAALDQAGFETLPILSYSVKYASAMYGPFGQAAEGAPHFGDRATYQMDVANGQEALRECALDIAEGADMLMVKPAHTYLDVIYRVKAAFPGVPLAAYHTSAEYSMIKAAAEKGWINEARVVREVLTSIYRAGADFVITYFAKEMAARNAL